jgi:protein phosphatase
MDDDDEERVRAEFESGFMRCQKRIAREAERMGLTRKSVGTTLTLAYVAWPHLYLAHAGDSCAFLYRNHELQRLTSPHTLARRMRERDLVGPDNRISKRFENVLVNAVGGGSDDIEVEFHCMELNRGDALLLCTDGLLAHVDEDEIQASLESTNDSEACCHRLVELANRRGGRDNITVVMARTDKNHMAVAQAQESSKAPSERLQTKPERRIKVAASC